MPALQATGYTTRPINGSDSAPRRDQATAAQPPTFPPPPHPPDVQQRAPAHDADPALAEPDLSSSAHLPPDVESSLRCAHDHLHEASKRQYALDEREAGIMRREQELDGRMQALDERERYLTARDRNDARSCRNWEAELEEREKQAKGQLRKSRTLRHAAQQQQRQFDKVLRTFEQREKESHVHLQGPGAPNLGARSMSSQGQDAYDELKRSADVELRQRHADIGQRERDIAQLTLASDKKHEQAERLMSAAKHQKAIVEETMESLQEDRKYLGEQGITVMSGWGVLWDGVASLPSVQQPEAALHDAEKRRLEEIRGRLARRRKILDDASDRLDHADARLAQISTDLQTLTQRDVAAEIELDQCRSEFQVARKRLARWQGHLQEWEQECSRRDEQRRVEQGSRVDVDLARGLPTSDADDCYDAEDGEDGASANHQYQGESDGKRAGVGNA